MKLEIQTRTSTSGSGLNLYILEHEWPVRDVVTHNQLGYPATVKTFEDEWEDLLESEDVEGDTREEWWFKMFDYRAPESWSYDFKVKKFVEGYLAGNLAVCNGHGVMDGKQSILTGENPGHEGIGQETLLMKGNPVNVVGIAIVKAGIKWFPIQAIDSSKTLPNWKSVIDVPYLVHTATMIYPDGHTSHFPHLSITNVEEHPVPLPVIRKGGIMLVAEYATIGGVFQRVLRKMEPDELTPNPIRGAR